MIPFLILCAIGTFEVIFLGTFFCYLFAFAISICTGVAECAHPERTITDLPLCDSSNSEISNLKSEIPVPSNAGDGGRLRDDQAAVNIIAPDMRDRTADVPLTVPATAHHVPSLEEIRR